MNDLDDMMTTIHFTRRSDLSWRKYTDLDCVITDYLDDVKKSSVDVFGNLAESPSYDRAVASLNIMYMLELIEPEEYERLMLLFSDAVSKAHWRHERLLKALERRESMRSMVKARRVGALG